MSRGSLCHSIPLSPKHEFCALRCSRESMVRLFVSSTQLQADVSLSSGAAPRHRAGVGGPGAAPPSCRRGGAGPPQGTGGAGRGRAPNESSAQWHAWWAHAFGVRQPCWRFCCLLPCGRRSTASPTHSGSMAPALQGHVPYTPPQTAHKAGRMTFPQRRFIVVKLPVW